MSVFEHPKANPLLGGGQGGGSILSEAFTLAEILITLGIIGIIAAMTIPGLITDYQKKSTAAQLKKTYALIANAVRLSEEDNGELSGWVIPRGKAVVLFDQYLMPYLKVSKQKIPANTLIYYKPNGQRETGFNFLYSECAQYTLLSGAQILISDGTVPVAPSCADCGTGFNLYIDLNGYNNKPNRFGRDMFVIQISSNKGPVLTYSDDGEWGSVRRTKEQLKNGPSKYNYQCNRNNRGLWCGALIKEDGWSISKDYPW